jgi:hypothetical protein
MHRVFCATPEQSEAEHQAFHRALGREEDQRGVCSVSADVALKWRGSMMPPI